MNETIHPIKIYFEVTNYCNFHCDFCPVHVSTRPNQHMDFSLFQKGIDEIAAEHLTGTVGFHILGEPLMYPRILDAVRYARSKGLRTEMNTNGSLLTPERVQGLVEAGLDALAISVQLLGEEDHRSRGTNLPFEVYYQRVLDALRQVRAMNADMEVVFCLMNKSSHKFFDIDAPMRMNWERQANRKKLAGYIVDVSRAAGKPLSGARVERGLLWRNLNAPQFIQIDRSTKVYIHPFGDWGNAFTSRKVYPAHLGTCAYALNNVGVLSSGEVTICCPDYDGSTTLGNLNTTSLRELLSSNQVLAIRQGFKDMKVVHPHCQHCIGGSSPTRTLLKGLLSIYLFKWMNFQPAQVKEISI
jgi:sulfatase maturation enzyme AslB (radical SAM superfamily)